MQTLPEQIKQLQFHIPDYATTNTAVSSASVGWHINHCLLVYTKIYDALQYSDPALYKRSFNFKKLIVYTFKKIPRGRGKAPKTVQPLNVLLPDELQLQVQKAMEKINALTQLNATHYFEHPYFGNLNVKETIKFLAIHSNHHLKIINDILKN